MSYIVSAACVRLKCPGVAKAVLMQLADMANDQGHAWPTIDTLCMRTDWGRTAVHEAIEWLEKHQAIAADRSNGRKTVYWITPDSFTGERHPDPRELSTNRYAKRTSTSGAPVCQTDTTSTPGGLNQCAKRTLTINNHQEPSIPRTPDGGVNNFDAVVQEYPAKRVNLSKAAEAWRKLAPSAELQAAILDAVRVMARSPQWLDKEGQYAPQLAKWLKLEGWKDPAARVPTPTPAPTPAPTAPPPTPEQMAANKARVQELLEASKRSLAEKELKRATA